MIIFATGGAGYIGSHTCVELIKAGHQTVIYDNLTNSSAEVLNRIEKITGQRPFFIQGDVRDRALMEETMRLHRCNAVIHFAGLKSVGESTEKPLDYYDNNVIGTIRVAEAMKAVGIDPIIFSSSATVYGIPQKLPLTEDHPLSAITPYGHTKLMSEDILKSFSAAHPNHFIGLLRYFNPVGAHESGLIGEDPKGTPNNLMPYVTQVAIGKRDHLNVLGNDYDTPDGTGVRDYIHVVDLAIGHVLALEKLVQTKQNFTVNLGMGTGYSVFDIIKTFEKASGRTIPYQIASRRAGDVASNYADPSLAKQILGWTAQRNLFQMCADSWNWQSKNPNGYM